MPVLPSEVVKWGGCVFRKNRCATIWNNLDRDVFRAPIILFCGFFFFSKLCCVFLCKTQLLLVTKYSSGCMYAESISNCATSPEYSSSTRVGRRQHASSDELYSTVL
jgi:hypothetical protein